MGRAQLTHCYPWEQLKDEDTLPLSKLEVAAFEQKMEEHVKSMHAAVALLFPFKLPLKQELPDTVTIEDEVEDGWDIVLE